MCIFSRDLLNRVIAVALLQKDCKTHCFEGTFAELLISIVPRHCALVVLAATFPAQYDIIDQTAQLWGGSNSTLRH